MLRCVFVFLSLLLFATAASAAQPDLSGLWKQDNESCQPRRSNDVTLRIEQHDPDLSVETTISRGSGSPRHAIQKYTTDGKVSVSTGADGDEFHTSVVRRDSALIFSIEEHEDGRVIQSNEIWSVTENGETLKRIRERAGGERQIFLYRRVVAGRSEGRSDIPKAAGR